MSIPPTISIQLFSAASRTDSIPMGPRPNCATLTLFKRDSLFRNALFTEESCKSQTGNGNFLCCSFVWSLEPEIWDFLLALLPSPIVHAIVPRQRSILQAIWRAGRLSRRDLHERTKIRPNTV